MLSFGSKHIDFGATGTCPTKHSPQPRQWKHTGHLCCCYMIVIHFYVTCNKLIGFIYISNAYYLLVKSWSHNNNHDVIFCKFAYKGYRLIKAWKGQYFVNINGIQWMIFIILFIHFIYLSIFIFLTDKLPWLQITLFTCRAMKCTFMLDCNSSRCIIVWLSNKAILCVVSHNMLNSVASKHRSISAYKWYGRYVHSKTIIISCYNMTC